MSEFKPCPFCGATPIWSICGENNDLLRFGCPNNCVVWMEPFTRPYHENALKSISERWNRRTQPANEPLTLEEWGEDYGDCLWWKFPIEEAPYCGSPLDSDWPGYHTHFTRLTYPDDPNDCRPPERNKIMK